MIKKIYYKGIERSIPHKKIAEKKKDFVSNRNKLHFSLFSYLLAAAILSLGSILSCMTVRAESIWNQAKFQINYPRILSVYDGSMVSGKKVTYDCLRFGSYPQSKVAASEDIYQILAAKPDSAWDSNGDITLENGSSYRRLTQNSSGTPKYSYYKYKKIKWRVLDINQSNGEILLLSDVVLDSAAYDTANEAVSWTNSTIRSWLNDTESGFLSTAFSEKEQSDIGKIDLTNIDDIQMMETTTGEAADGDSVFLLSEKEVLNITDNCYGFSPDKTSADEAKRCKCSEYASDLGAGFPISGTYAGCCSWWLRSSINDSNNTISVNPSGKLGYGTAVTNRTVGVRPVVQVHISSDYIHFAGIVCTDGLVDENAESGEGDMCGYPNIPTRITYTPKTPTIRKRLRISLSGISHEIAAGKKIKLKVNIEAKSTTISKIKWRSNNKKVATVSQDGTVTLKKNSGGKTVNIKVIVNDTSLTWKIRSMKGICKKIKINGPRTVKAGKSLTLRASVKATKGANTKIKWKSSNKKYAAINSNGVLQAKKAGKGQTVQITAMARDGSNVTKTITVKIK